MQYMSIIVVLKGSSGALVYSIQSSELLEPICILILLRSKHRSLASEFDNCGRFGAIYVNLLMYCNAEPKLLRKNMQNLKKNAVPNMYLRDYLSIHTLNDIVFKIA